MLTGDLDSPYAGARAALATRHGKLSIVALPLWRGVRLTTVSVDVDTDQLGTFSGEIPRPAGPVETAVRKARLGMAATGLPVGLASEGSVSDPWGLGVGVVDRELVVLVDDEHGLIVVGRAAATDVVAVAATVAPGDPLDRLISRADAPPHHLVVRPAGTPPPTASDRPDPAWVDAITKAVADEPTLREAVIRAAAVSPQGRAHVETDLRAHLCPSRRPVIAAAAADLATRLATLCPWCASPGWGVSEVASGRACSWCDGPTDEPGAYRWACPACDATDVCPIEPCQPGNPARCSRCNP